LRGAPDSDRRIFVDVVRPSDVVVDVGSNRGYYTVLFSHLARAGSVHAFEPVAATYDALEQAVRAEAASSQVVLNRAALADTAGSRTVYQPEGDPAQASLRVHDRGSWATAHRILEETSPATTLDAYIAARKLPRIDLLKVDVEGAELPVLRGAESTLARFRPLLHLEVCARWQKDFGYSPRDLRHALIERGYTAFLVLSDVDAGRAWGDPFERLASRAPEESANVLCIQPEQHLARLPRRLRRSFHSRS
jgi:FkbM family methyltransferase